MSVVPKSNRVTRRKIGDLVGCPTTKVAVVLVPVLVV